jgi:hypothetical protein
MSETVGDFVLSSIVFVGLGQGMEGGTDAASDTESTQGA